MTHDAVRRPSHYQSPEGMEAFDAIEAFFATHPHRAAAFKYLVRAGQKDPRGVGSRRAAVEDLRRAARYIERAVDWLERQEAAEAPTPALFDVDNPEVVTVTLRGVSGILTDF